MTCDDMRERLTEHVLGTLDDAQDAQVQRHLRGCAGCRQELSALDEGLTQFAHAAHDVGPPPELEERVTNALREEWRERPVPSHRRPPLRWLAAAAAVVAIVGTLGWGLSQQHRADRASEGASSYAALLHTLGGKDFRVGQLQAAAGQTVEGSVIVYDSHEDQSWAVVFVRAPGVEGSAGATLHAADGRTVDLWDLTIDHGGDGAAWLVTSVNLERFDRITVTGPDGRALASASIAPA